MMYEKGEQFVRILTKAIRYCSFSNLVHALYECGYSDLADKMNFNTSVSDVLTDIVSKVDGSHSTALALYSSLKQNIDNGSFLDEKRFLQMKTQHLLVELQCLNPESTRRRSCLLDKLLVVYCTTVEVSVADVSSRLEGLEVIRNDKCLRESQIAEAIVHSKEGATYALNGDFERAEELMFRSRVALHSFKPSWATYYHYFGEVFLKCAVFCKHPNIDTKQSLLYRGFSGLRLVENEDEQTQRFWKRIYISFMLYGLLGLNWFLAELNVEITREDRALANTLLTEFNRLSGGMETRREKIYAFLMAKLLEIEDLELALTYARRAETLSKAGGGLRKGEAENISAFVSKLSNRLASFTDKIELHE